MKTCSVGVRAIIKKDNKYLLVQRANDDRYKAGYWEFPGGKSDCQDPKIAVKREIREETGLKVGKVKFAGSKKDGKHLVKYFNMKTTGKVKLKESEVQGYGWFNRNQAKKLNLVNHTRKQI